MAIKVAVYFAPEKGRSVQISEAMETGALRHGYSAKRFPMHSYREPDCDIAVFYGLMRSILDGYRRVGRPAIYIDLGYWGRHEGGRRAGFHKIVLNARHPIAYFQKRKHDASRFNHFRIPIREWKGPQNNGYILLVGMSGKAASAEGFRPEEWENGIVEEIRKYTTREIVYRPKPNWGQATRIRGTRMVRGTPADGDILRYLDNCHAIVTHHSNASIEGLLYGVPVFCWDGLAIAPGKACSDLSLIENPPVPVNREQWAWDIAWTQWNVAEMHSGAAWQYLRDEGLIP